MPVTSQKSKYINPVNGELCGINTFGRGLTTSRYLNNTFVTS